MADSSSDSELDLLDDLQGLQAELAALRAELGDDYVTVSAVCTLVGCWAC